MTLYPAAAFVALGVVGIQSLLLLRHQRRGAVSDASMVAAVMALAWPAFGGGTASTILSFMAGWCVMLAFQQANKAAPRDS